MRIAFLTGMLLSMAGLSLAAEFTGYLADAKCAKAGKAGSAQHSACSKKCVDGGEAIVLDGATNKIYQIKNPDKVKPHLGFKVALQATLDGDTLDVEGGRHLE